MMDFKDKLEKMQETIKDKEIEKSKIEGRLESLNSEIEKLGFKSISEVEKELDKLTDEIETKKKRLSELENELNAFDWE